MYMYEFWTQLVACAVVHNYSYYLCIHDHYILPVFWFLTNQLSLLYFPIPLKQKAIM